MSLIKSVYPSAKLKGCYWSHNVHKRGGYVVSIGPGFNMNRPIFQLLCRKFVYCFFIDLDHPLCNRLRTTPSTWPRTFAESVFISKVVVDAYQVK